MRTFWCARAAPCLLLVATASTAASPAHTHDQQTLRAYTQQLLDAVAPGEKTPWKKLLAPTFLRMDEEGKVETKSQLLQELQPLPKGLSGRLHVDTFRVSFDRDLAIVAHEDQEELDYHGQMLRSRFRSFDTWRRTSAGWRLVGQHAAVVLKDPPAIAVSWTDKCEYGGTFRLAPSIELTINCEPTGLLASRNGRPDVHYRMEVPDVFFAPGQSRTRRIFQRRSDGKIAGFVDRREGEDIRWTKVG
jgi:hypothetical protein